MFGTERTVTIKMDHEFKLGQYYRDGADNVYIVAKLPDWPELHDEHGREWQLVSILNGLPWRSLMPMSRGQLEEVIEKEMGDDLMPASIPMIRNEFYEKILMNKKK